MSTEPLDEDTKDFLIDLGKAARSPDASDEWLAGFVRQYYRVPQIQKPVQQPRKLSILETVSTALACGCAFGLMGLAYRPNALGPALVASVLGTIAGYTVALRDRHKK